MDPTNRSRGGGVNFFAAFILMIMILFLAFITSVEGLFVTGTAAGSTDPNNQAGLGIGGGGDSLNVATYTVQRGDTLSAIAGRYDTNVSALVQANPSIQDPSLIYPGQVLTIPAPVIIPDTGAVPDPGAAPELGTEAGAEALDDSRLYLIAMNGTNIEGETTACGGAAVPVAIDAGPAVSPLAGALNTLLNLEGPNPYPNLYNALHRSNLLLENVDVDNQTARIYLTGEISIDGVCDAPRIREQLQQTALQFDDIEMVEIYVNNTPIDELLASGGSLTYRIQAGDSLQSVALRFGITEAALVAANPQIEPASPLPAGETLTIPSVTLRPTPQAAYIVYIVVEGDTIGEIADRYNTSIEAIRAANPEIADITRISPRQSIRIPRF